MRRAAALLLLLTCLGACDDDPTWERGADAPLSPRWGASVGWTGSEVIVVGGVTSPPTDPASDGGGIEQEYAADGAAYDPDADQWRPIPDAPMPIGYWFRSAMAGNTMVVFATGQKSSGLRGPPWMAYDASDDSWRVLPGPPRPALDPGYLSSWGTRVYVLDRDSRVMVLDVSTDTWSVLPPSDQTPPLDGTSVVGTDLGPVVTGDVAGSPSRRAEIWEGDHWRRFQDPIAGGVWWHWTGERLVDPDPQVGGEGEPAGGVLDVVSGHYRGLPDPPGGDDFAGGTRGAGSAGPLMVSFGYLYDDRDGSWTRLPLLSESLTGTSGLMAGDRLVVFGGFDDSNGYEDPDGLSNQLWVLDLDDLTS